MMSHNMVMLAQRIAQGGGGGPQTASDNFDSYTDGALLGGQTNWGDVAGTIKIVKPSTDGRFMGNTGSKNNVCRYTAGTWSANQYSEVTITVSALVNFIGAAVRCTGSNDAYYFVATPGNIYLGKYNNTVQTDITSAAVSLSVNDVLRIEVSGSGSGTRITVKQNGIVKLSSIDPGGTYIDSGNPGVAAYTSGNTTEMGGGLWNASDN